MAGQIVNLSATWDGTRFHCPACGAEIFDDQGVTHAACSHLLFTWDSESGMFDSVSQVMPDRIHKAALSDPLESESDDDEIPAPWENEFTEFLEEQDVVFCLNCSGLACGPVSLTVAVGVRFPNAGDSE